MELFTSIAKFSYKEFLSEECSFESNSDPTMSEVTDEFKLKSYDNEILLFELFKLKLLFRIFLVKLAFLLDLLTNSLNKLLSVVY